MDPIIDSDWLMNKSEPIYDSQSGNIARSWVWRERGIKPPNSPSNKTVLENVAEDILVQKPLKIRCCDLPGYPRSTFLMVFSPDGTKVASTHGNHNVYVSELASGKHVRILKGHPRTPWCIAFHPSHPELIGSGCLGGQVRVWDIASGGSEVWSVQKETVIASIAFHPREQLLVIATSNELYFWDWSQPAPFTKVSTDDINEKVRYVAFDSLGYKLITGISLYNTPPCAPTVSERNAHSSPPANYRRQESEDSPNNRLDPTGPTGDVIVNSYQNLVQRYDSLVRNYQRLFLVRHRLTATTPPPSTTDRGTDPMETDSATDNNGPIRPTRRTNFFNEDDNAPTRPTRRTIFTEDDPTPSTSRTSVNTDNADTDPLSHSRLLNLDALTLERDSMRTRSSSTTRQESSVFGSRPSAFQPLNEGNRASLWQALPSPFTPPRRTLTTSVFNQENTGSSRTNVFPTYRSVTPPRPPTPPPPPAPVDPQTSFNNTISDSVDAIFPSDNSVQIDYLTPSSPDVNSPIQVVYGGFPPETSSNPTTSSTNTTTQSPVNTPVDAQTINESLDLIRDILRDSGTRLLNLITNMSLSNLSRERRRERSRAHSDGDGSSDGTSRSRNTRTRPRLFSSGLPNSLFLSSSSESDSDNPPEVNIFRTRNASFREDAARNSNRPNASGSTRPEPPTDRLVFELNDELVLEENFELGGFNVSPNPRTFHVRSQNPQSAEESTTTTTTRTNEEPRENRTRSSSFDPNMPSTSRDNFWSGGNTLTSQEAFRKVRGGVNALQKHVQQLTNFWVRGQRISMRDLRNMWENLRRRILMLHRETGRQDVPSYYSRSLLERCMMLSDMSENVSRSSSRTRGHQRTEERNAEASREQAPAETGDNEPSPSPGTSNTSRQNRNPQTRSSSGGRFSPFARRRLQPNHRWRHEDEIRRRARNPTSNRLSPRLSRPRRELARAIEISATRHEIRMRAMQVLSVMFNMMMMCLEEPGLSQLIINMLRTLKKALALTCLMLMSNRNGGRGSGSTNPSPQRSDNRNSNNSGNTDSNTDGNVNDTNTSESVQNSVSSEAEEDRARESTSNNGENAISLTMVSSPSTSTAQNASLSLPSTSAAQKWSNRLAVQIATANRNTSVTARCRRELYLESRRLKALHRTNPTKHPLIRKRVPPLGSHRIPMLRALPRKIVKTPTPRDPSPPIAPVIFPLRGPPLGEISNQEPSRLPPEVMNEFEHRINLIRIAHMQAVRLRNAARNRYRRLQTIRLYTPSSVREMFTLQDGNDQNQQGARSNSSENRPNLLNRERLVARVPINIHSEDMRQLHAGEALLQVNDAVNVDGQGNPQARLPRIHEYLQPIILAQNAVVVEDDDENNGEGNGFAGFGVRRVGMGGMAGLLDASVISDNFPSPSHRIQAWDFTSGDAPDIADGDKNIVVQRCRIHNDASIDISKDGRLLVALLPVPRLRNTSHWLGVYSLEWPRLGHCLHTAVLEQSAVSVALSPTGRHLAVGLGSRRFTSVHHARSSVFALLFRLDPLDGTSRTGLSPIKELEQTWEHGFTSLNCLRWAPQPGQGLVYANNTGQLIIMS
ncbi:uncharacterized protein LOC123711685 isoform X2 [Pieris brassicae]|uniref:uncharacterized protein LOC123711685 isoform X2 n=1 Tax=Pieris brassicae TaxID=7116 RepID=UPI001E660B2A|nr:uncharacterized protein LOC123711685 isoform X2 [Pieris brassicae]